MSSATDSSVEYEAVCLETAKKKVLAKSNLAANTGVAGICQDCGGEIEVGRLMVLPKTSRCAGCAHKRAK